MRKVNSVQLLVLIVCLFVVGALTYWRPQGRTVHNRQPLEQALSVMDDWKKTGNSSLSSAIVQELKLDDYVFQTYTNQQDSVTLYVGYYYSGKKVGAAHDPQVCYPGQGWKLSGKEQRSQQINNYKKLEYSRIVAELEDKKEEIFYWFQVDDRSASGTLQQKLLLFKKKFFNQGEGNAFVRISTSLNNKSEQQAEELILGFIDDFYPAFVNHISGPI
ncbi:exosortase C-terminal domain/associated protein EpsI [uncultured Desulfuromusa sp.]|uniref:exosortase C-terminal domain/associated protein EpsI n=1 Tax=uncultured Desulfuromusa sp. TaxID=219183 RepID=UPI002AA85384|nr:exosortase C-terminal domain/associated protein EpsI [uncultured Desulfuromusa sp.]